MIYTLYEELQEHTKDETIGNIPEDLKHRIELYLEFSAPRSHLDYYAIYLDNQKIGMTQTFAPWAKIPEHVPQILYFLCQPRRTKAEAKALSEPAFDFIYYFDEYWWRDDRSHRTNADCNDAWYPSFSTLEALIKNYLNQEKGHYMTYEQIVIDDKTNKATLEWKPYAMTLWEEVEDNGEIIEQTGQLLIICFPEKQEKAVINLHRATFLPSLWCQRKTDPRRLPYLLGA